MLPHPGTTVNKPSYLLDVTERALSPPEPIGTLWGVVEAASGVDWSEVHAVRLLGVALGAIFLLWAIKRMFRGK